MQQVQIIYRKTELGLQEIEQRSGKINARQRTMLIMIDGKKCLRVLSATTDPTQLRGLLETLLKLKLIEQLPVPASSAPSPAEHDQNRFKHCWNFFDA